MIETEPMLEPYFDPAPTAIPDRAVGYFAKLSRIPFALLGVLRIRREIVMFGSSGITSEARVARTVRMIRALTCRLWALLTAKCRRPT